MALISIGNIYTLIEFFNGTYGQGTAAEPLEVVLTADIDFADMPGVYSWAAGTGAASNDWYVDFDGGWHTISNIYFSGGDLWFLFPNLRGGCLKNLYLRDMYIIAGDRASLVRNMYNAAYIQDVHITGRIESGNYAAGFAMYVNSSSNKVRECSFSGELKSKNAGGIVYSRSNSPNAKIVNCCFIGKIDASTQAAGIICTSSTAVNSFFKGIIISTKVYPLTNTANMATCCYAVLYDGTSNTVQNVAQNNCLYDSDKATEAGITVPGLTAATSAQLKSSSYMRNAGYAV
ncbi:MAG: hypothetical protein IKS17_02695 [Firmicutes bacterium]|nr:hypothetical protein [Bacillota bacterium]